MSVTFTTPTTTDLAGHISNGIVERITAAVRAHLARMRARHERRQLLDCEDHLLRDIGVNRFDVEAELRNSYR